MCQTAPFAFLEAIDHPDTSIALSRNKHEEKVATNTMIAILDAAVVVVVNIVFLVLLATTVVVVIFFVIQAELLSVGKRIPLIEEE